MDDFPALTLQVAVPADARAVTALLTIAYTRLLAADYCVAQLRAVLPSVTAANRSLLAGGQYHLVQAGEVLAGGGGWSLRGERLARLHYFATHPNWLRMGVGSMVMEACLRQARARGAIACECSATLGAVPFYRARGFRVAGRGEMRLPGGLGFPVAEMVRDLQK